MYVFPAVFGKSERSIKVMPHGGNRDEKPCNSACEEVSLYAGANPAVLLAHNA